uniref:Uncharacterized protein n=2 Tax=Oryza TaxID=4527 RepID=A0A0E0QUU3_ORYRU
MAQPIDQINSYLFLFDLFSLLNLKNIHFVFDKFSSRNLKNTSQKNDRDKRRSMAMAMAKLFITGLSTVITCSSAVVFKGAAMAVVLLLMLVTARITDKNCSSKQTATEHAGSEPMMRVSTVCSMKTELHQKNQALQASRKLAEGKEPRP